MNTDAANQARGIQKDIALISSLQNIVTTTLNISLSIIMTVERPKVLTLLTKTLIIQGMSIYVPLIVLPLMVVTVTVILTMCGSG